MQPQGVVQVGHDIEGGVANQAADSLNRDESNSGVRQRLS